MKINYRIMAISNKISGKTRFEARLTQDEKAFFERAAAIGGYRSLTEFVIRSAVKQAEEIIQAEEALLSSKRDAELFFDAIFNPLPPNEKLKAAAAKFKTKQ